MRRRHALPLLTALLLGTGCADMKDLMAFSSEVQQHYGAPAAVNLSNDTHLTITFQAVPPMIAKADSAGRAHFAQDVASFSKAHYPNAARLQDVTIAFANVSRMGPVTITRTEAPYTFLMRELP